MFLERNLRPPSPQERTGLVLHDAVRDHRVPLQSIEHLLAAFPDSINEADTTERHVNVRRVSYSPKSISYGRLPIHAALESGRYDVARFLLTKSPTAAKVGSGSGQLCLHILFNDSSNHPPIQLVRDLIDAYPEALSLADFTDCLPLHSGILWIAGMYKKTEEDIAIIQLLFEKYPAAAKTTSVRRRDILDMVAQTGEIALVSMVTDVYPELVTVPNNSNYFVQACQNGFTDIVRHFLNNMKPSYPTLTSSSCYDLELAIHAILGASYRLTPNHVDIVRMIVELAPETIMARNRWGQLPIHKLAVASSNEIKLELVLAELLINKSSNNLLRIPMLDTHKLPIHLAASRMNWEMVKLFVEKAPETVHEKARDGDLPIHVAASTGNLYVTGFLAQNAPETLHAKRADGSLPIHLAASRGNVELVEFLAAKAPETLYCSTTGTRPGGRLPIHASKDNSSMNCLVYMATAAPTTLKHLAPPIGALDGGGPMLHIAVNQGRFTYRDPYEIKFNFFEFLLRNSPLETKDHYGDNILHIALHKRLHIGDLSRLLKALNRQNLLASLLLDTNWLGRTPLHYLNVASLDCMRLVISCCSREQLRQALQKKQKIYPQMTALHYYLYSWQLWKVKHERRQREMHLVRRKGVFPSDSLERIKLFVESCPESLLMKDEGSVPLRTALRNEWPIEVCYYLAMSTFNFDLEFLAVTTISDSVDIVYNYLSKFVGEWAKPFGMFVAGS